MLNLIRKRTAIAIERMKGRYNINMTFYEYDRDW